MVVREYVNLEGYESVHAVVYQKTRVESAPWDSVTFGGRRSG